MIIKILIGLAFIGSLIVFLARRPHYHKNIKWDDFKRFLNELIGKCVDGSLLIIKHEPTKSFIQFAIHSTSNSSQLLHFAFPDAPWSREYVNPLKESLIESGYEFKVRKTDSKFVTQFIEVDLLGKPDELLLEGEKIAHLALKVLGLNEENVFRLHFDGNLKK